MVLLFGLYIIGFKFERMKDVSKTRAPKYPKRNTKLYTSKKTTCFTRDLREESEITNISSIFSFL